VEIVRAARRPQLLEFMGYNKGVVPISGTTGGFILQAINGGPTASKKKRKSISMRKNQEINFGGK